MGTDKQTRHKNPNGVGVGFDTDKYIQHQAASIRKFMRRSKDVLYIEFGGKIIHDRHSARVLPGYRENAKFELMLQIDPKPECVYVISLETLRRGRVNDAGVDYSTLTITTLKELIAKGAVIRHLALTDFEQNSLIYARKVIHWCKQNNIQIHQYPSIANMSGSVIALGSFVHSTGIIFKKRVIFVVSQGSGNSKFDFVLHQLFSEMVSRHAPRYIKVVTFPVSKLPIRHPVNLAYLAGVADYGRYLIYTNRTSGVVLSDRDEEKIKNIQFLADAVHSKLQRHLRKIRPETALLNNIGESIIDDLLVKKEAAAEIARRLVRYRDEVRKGLERTETISRLKKIIQLL